MNYIHGCWVTGADRVCEDGTKGCSRRHPPAPPPTVDLRKTKCLPEIWLAQASKDGVWCGYYGQYHPNPEAVRRAAGQLRKDFPIEEGWRIHVGRYVLAEIEEDTRPESNRIGELGPIVLPGLGEPGLSERYEVPGANAGYVTVTSVDGRGLTVDQGSPSGGDDTER